MNTENIFTNSLLMFYLCGGTYLMNYVYYKIMNRFEKYNKNKLYIVRRLPFLNLDDEIRKKIKKNSDKNYRILSTYDFIEKEGYFDVRNLSKYNSIVLSSCIKLFNRGERDIYLMNRNQYCWEYEAYVKLAKVFGYEPIIIEFVRENVNKCLENLEFNEMEYKNAISEIKKYELDNKLFTKRITL